MTDNQARLIETTDKRSGKACFAVAYISNSVPYRGQQVQTQWTTYRGEACNWGKVIRDHGYCMSGKEFPAA